LRKFIDSFLAIVAPIHAMTSSSNSLQWEKNQHKAFDEMKRKIIQAIVLMLPNLQKPFDVKTNASGYTMGVVLMQGERPICYHYEVFHGAILN
jgi:hypothetical protein